MVALCPPSLPLRAGGRGTCARVDEPERSGQQGSDHERREGDAHHRQRVQPVQHRCSGKHTTQALLISQAEILQKFTPTLAQKSFLKFRS